MQCATTLVATGVLTALASPLDNKQLAAEATRPQQKQVYPTHLNLYFVHRVHFMPAFYALYIQ